MSSLRKQGSSFEAYMSGFRLQFTPAKTGAGMTE